MPHDLINAKPVDGRDPGVLRLLAAVAVHGPDQPALRGHAQAAAVGPRAGRAVARARRVRGARRAPDALRAHLPHRDPGRPEHRPDLVALLLRADQRVRLHRVALPQGRRTAGCVDHVNDPHRRRDAVQGGRRRRAGRRDRGERARRGRSAGSSAEAEPHAFYLSAWEEDQYIIAQANAEVDEDGRFVQDRVNARQAGGTSCSRRARRSSYIDVSPEAAGVGGGRADPVPRDTTTPTAR